jgi:hypothetical protein
MSWNSVAAIRLLLLFLSAFLANNFVFTANAAQPDYTNAIWRSAFPGHWYTTGTAHAFVVEHDMEGYYWTTISYFQQSGTQASIHYCVNGLQNGSDTLGHSENNPTDPPAGEITQMVENQFWAWHVLCWNRYMFGTEHEGFVSSPVWYSDAMYQASGGLTRYLCDTYGIPKDRNHIIGHNEWQNATWRAWMTNNWPQIDPTCNNHTDPGQYWDWNKFMSIVGGAPGIGIQPFSHLVEPGSNVTFTATGTGGTPISLQWFKNGTRISGATGTNLVLTNAQGPDAAGYSLVVSNLYGSATSRVATLTISPAWVNVFTDNLDTDSSTNWNFFWGSTTNIPDYSTNWAFDYHTSTYVKNGVTNTIPPATSSSGTTKGLKVSVNKLDAVAATVGVSFYPRNLVLSNDYALRFDMWINYNGVSGGGSGSTEYATFGLNHSGNEANWTTTATNSDGIWFAVDGEGGAASDYRAYAGNGSAAPTQLSFANGGLAASGAASDDAADSFFRSLFPSPTYETAGAPGKHWVQAEVSQIGNLITWQLNGVVVAQRTNTSPYTNGMVMIGYMDPFSSIANPGADNFIIFDNVRVLASAAGSTVNNLTIAARPNSAIVSWGSLAATACQVEYGIAPGFQNFSALETVPSLAHSVLLNGLARNTNYVFRIHSHIGANDYASATYSFSTDVGVIVDNPQATYGGNWVLSTAPDQFGGYFQYAVATDEATPSAQANYTPTLPISAKYDVSIWYPQSANRPTNVPVSIFFDSGFTQTVVNETTGGGGWRLLASSLSFSPGNGGFASIGNNSGDTNTLVAADAFKWAYSTSQDAPTDGSVPSWWSAYYFGSNVDGTTDFDHDGYSAFSEYVMGTDPTNSASHFIFTTAKQTNTLMFTFSPWLNGRTYELQSSTNLSDSLWTTLSDGPSLGATAGTFTATNSGPGSKFFRISVHMIP